MSECHVRSDIFFVDAHNISIACHIFLSLILLDSGVVFKTISKTAQYELTGSVALKGMLALAQNVSGEKVKFETNINYQIKLNPKNYGKGH